MSTLQELLSQSVTQTMGLSDILGKRRQEATQLGQALVDQAGYQANAMTNSATIAANASNQVSAMGGDPMKDPFAAVMATKKGWDTQAKLEAEQQKLLDEQKWKQKDYDLKVTEAQGNMENKKELLRLTEEKQKDQRDNQAALLDIQGQLLDVKIRELDQKKELSEAELALKQELGDKKLQLDYAKQSLEAQKALVQKMKLVPAAQVTDIADMQTGIGLLDGQIESLKKYKIGFNPLDKVTALNPMSKDMQSYKQFQATTKQIIGKALEGGVLRKEDEIKYEKILPVIGDTKEILQNKANQLRKMLVDKYNNQVDALGQSGYDVKGLPPMQQKQYYIVPPQKGEVRTNSAGVQIKFDGKNWIEQ